MPLPHLPMVRLYLRRRRHDQRSEQPARRQRKQRGSSPARAACRPPPLLPAARGARRHNAASSAGCCVAWAQCRAARASGRLPSMAGHCMAAWRGWRPCTSVRLVVMLLQQPAGPQGPAAAAPSRRAPPVPSPPAHLHYRQVQRGRCRPRGLAWRPQAGQQAQQRRDARPRLRPMAALLVSESSGSAAEPNCTMGGARFAPGGRPTAVGSLPPLGTV